MGDFLHGFLRIRSTEWLKASGLYADAARSATFTAGRFAYPTPSLLTLEVPYKVIPQRKQLFSSYKQYQQAREINEPGSALTPPIGSIRFARAI